MVEQEADFYREASLRAAGCILKSCNIEVANVQVIDLCAQLLELVISKIAGHAKDFAGHAKRSTANIFDFQLAFLQLRISIASLLPFIEKAKQAASISAPRLSFSARLPDLEVHKNAKCIKLETNYRPKHFFDYLPSLPSVHTFKRTASKIIPSSDKALIAWRKSDERHTVERNLKAFYKQFIVTINK